MNKTRIEYFIDALNNTLSVNYQVIEGVFNSEYGYPELDPLRDEICKCILCGLYQASITLTNHLLESSLKKCLALKYSITYKQENTSLLEAFKEGIKKYDKLGLEDTINRACTQGLITKEQKKQYKEFRDIFRDPYSHATSSEIFGNTTVKGKVVSLVEGEPNELLLEKIFERTTDQNLEVKDLLPIQGIIQSMLAKQQSVPYFLKVDEIIRDMLMRIKAYR